MNSFGTIKTNILQYLLENYVNGNKENMGSMLKTLRSNKDFKDLYNFYEEFETKHIKEKSIAETYVEKIGPVINEAKRKIGNFPEKISDMMKNIVSESNPLYDDLDIISENDDLTNDSVLQKIHAKQRLIEHLTKEKEQIEETMNIFTINEKLLTSVLVNNFNTMFESSMDESEKELFTKISSLKKEDLAMEFVKLKEEVSEKVKNMMTEEKNEEVAGRLKDVDQKLQLMTPTKFNYYKLMDLKNGI